MKKKIRLVTGYRKLTIPREEIRKAVDEVFALRKSAAEGKSVKKQAESTQ